MQFVLQQLSSLDFWTFVVTLLALIATVWYGRREVRIAREQLSLARRGAESRPVLEVAAMELIAAQDVDAVLDTAKERKAWIEQLEDYELASRRYWKKHDAAKQDPFHLAPRFEIPPPDPRAFRSHDHPLFAQQEYDGPILLEGMSVTSTYIA
jgi:hypothetical protein